MLPIGVLMLMIKPGRQALEAPLVNQGYRLAFAADGRQALEQTAALQPDLILLDVMMPDVDVFKVCQRLRADPRLAEIPAVTVTALGDRAARLHGLATGADDCMVKPFDRDELRARVRTITRLNRSCLFHTGRAQPRLPEAAQSHYRLAPPAGRPAEHKRR